MKIDTVHIHLGEVPAAAVSALLSSIFQSVPAALASSKATPPAIGEIWPGQGGIYCGIARGEDGQPDHHLILAVEASTKDFNWKAAQEHAKTIEADGHKDFALPTRFESALLYANVRDKLDTSNWHWTGTQSSEYDAFIQLFTLGTQSSSSKKFEARARFVRRFVL
jgi:hypothetical protein